MPFPMLRMFDPASFRVPYFVPPENLMGYAPQRVVDDNDEAEKLELVEAQHLETRKSPELLKYEKHTAVDKAEKARIGHNQQKRKPDSVTWQQTVSNEETQVTKQVKSDIEQHQSDPVKSDGEYLHSGYALTPGMFDHFLAEQPQLGSDMLSNAHLQFQTVMGLRPRQPAVLTKDVSTETQQTQAAGDPVSETIQNYYRERQQQDQQIPDGSQQQVAPSSLLPPDVFVQLQFSNRSDAVSNGASVHNRGYLNVADIGAEVLNDIEVSSNLQKHPRKSPDVTINEEKTAVKQPVHLKETREKPAGPVDADILKSSNDVVHHDLMKAVIKTSQRNQFLVNNMNAQSHAIERMIRTMDNDLQKTQLSQGSQPAVTQSLLSPEQHSLNSRRDESLKPVSPVYSDSVHDAAVADYLSSHMNRSSDSDPDPLHIKQWPEGLAFKLLNQTVQATRDGDRLSKDDLKKLFEALSPPQTLNAPCQQSVSMDYATSEQKEAVRKWMEKKKAEQMKEFRRRREELREAEKNPYKTTRKSNKQVTSKVLEEAEKERQAHRMHLQRAMLDRRNQHASELARELLSDEPPQLPLDTLVVGDTVRGVTVRSAQDTYQNPSSKRLTSRKKAASSPGDAWTDQNDVEDWNEYWMKISRYDKSLSMRMDTYETESLRKETAEKERPASAKEGRKVDKSAHTSVACHLPRPFTDFVRLQNPETIRQNRERVRATLEAQTAQINEVATKTINETSFDKLHPALARTIQKTTSAPRVVKTYAQRLQEMKRTTKPAMKTVPIRRPQSSYRQSHHTSLSDSSQPQKPRKTMTYAEQLQSLQTTKKTDYVKPEVRHKRPGVMQSHIPLHKPKNYTQQLKELQQQHNPPGPSKSGLPLRHQPRIRPYADPYSNSAELSALSSWSGDEEAARKLIYDHMSDIMPSASANSLSDRVLNNATDLDSIMGDDVSSVSFNSFLDWEEVDKLIAEND
jgi:hypothetical protein